jgi:thiamine-phosphate pyrophosphorylase
MTARPPIDRCRLVLILPQGVAGADAGARLQAALSGGDVASLILPQYGLDDAAFQALAERLCPLAQEAGAAVMIAGDSRVAGRVGADGLHIEAGKAAVAEAIARHAGRLIVGAGGIRTRDDALDLGEERPDYVFFGRFGYDGRPEPHPRNIGLAEWWAQIVEVPCVVLAGSAVASVDEVAATGADFVALSQAVFGDGIDPAMAVAGANARLDESAPRFEAVG